MLWFTLLIGYLVAGLITAAVTMYIFPPVEGFRPHIALLITTLVVYTLLWPVLVLLALWYNWRMFLLDCRWKVRSRTTQNQEQPTVPHLTVSKPR